MSQSNPHQPYVQEAFQAFYRWRNDNCKSTGHQEDGKFLPHDLLGEHLLANECRILNNLLSAIYQGHAVPISAKEVVSDYIEFLPGFMSCDELNDKHLPFKLDNPPREFPIDPTNPRFFEEFCDAQWTYWLPRIDANLNRRLDQNCVLPFIKKEEIAAGASAKIYLIEIYPLYHSLPRLENETDKSTNMNTFALKTYQGKDAEIAWTNEVQSFQKLGTAGSPNVVGFYTAFKHGSICHVVLEYADGGSMEKYLETNPPPANGVDIARLWKRALGLIRGLKDLHNGDQVVWHQDVKPANVLVFSDPQNNSPYASTFKITDLGTSHSKRIVASDEDRSDRDAQGTRTYGAPECYHSDGALGRGNNRVAATVDVFSLGCILSELAVWIAGGYTYLMQYREARRNAIGRIPDFQDGDCFHNGVTMLPIVAEWHSKVREKAISAADPFTPRFIPMIEEMLQEAQYRGDAMRFCTEAHTKFAEALNQFRKESPTISLPDDVLSSELRRQRQRSDPPVQPTPLGSNQSETGTWLAIHPASRFQSYDHLAGIHDSMTMTSGKNSSFVIREPSWPALQYPATRATRDQRTLGTSPEFESRQHVGGHNHAINAPLEGSPPFFENQNAATRRNTDQLGVRQSRRWSNVSGHHISSIMESEPDAISFESPVGLSSRNHVLQVRMNSNAFGHGGIQYSQGSNPYSPITAVSSLPARPSTSLPIVFPSTPLPTYSDPHHGSERPVVYMSREEAIEWRDAKKNCYYWNSTSVRLRDNWVLNFLDNRDSIIIIDDSRTMLKHWDDMTELLGIFAYMIKERDKDGLDLYFASSSEKHHGDSSTKLVNVVNKQKSTQDFGENDMSLRLEQVLLEYESKIRRLPDRTRGLNVYIFTDAVWTRSCNIVPAIDKIANTMLELKLPEKQVGLQFISFGDNPQFLDRLRLVDNFLVSKPEQPYDIVDTTPSTGNLYKMCRGAIDRDFDFASDATMARSSILPP